MNKPEDFRVREYLEARSNVFGPLKTENHAAGPHYVCNCPFCGKKGHFYINKSTSQWDCKQCGEKGNLRTLKRSLGDVRPITEASGLEIDLSGHKEGKTTRGTGNLDQNKATEYHERLLARADAFAVQAWEWLTEKDGERGFTEDTIRKFKLGVRVDSCPVHSGSGGRRRLSTKPVECDACGGSGSIVYVTIPFYMHGKLVNIKSRAIAPAKKAWRREKGCPSTLFNFDNLVLEGDEHPLILMEGEWDVMAMYQLGYTNVTTLPTGASGRLQDDWADLLAKVESVVICYDSDGAGRKGAERISIDLGRHRCWLVTIPAKDVNELMLLAEEQAKKEIKDAFRNAKGYKPTSLISSKELKEEIRQDLNDPDRYYGISTEWPSLDDIVGGIRPELTIVTGHSGSGKTTFTTALAGNLVERGVPGLIAPFESRVKPGILKMMRRISRCDPGSEEGMRKFDSAWTTLERWPLYWLNHYGSIDLVQLYESLKYAVTRLGIQFAVLDHLRFFVSQTREDRDEWTASRRTLQRLVEWCEELQLAIILVAHPKSGENEQAPLQMTDLMGGAATWQIPQNIWSVHVPRDKNRQPKKESLTIFTSLKSRHDTGKEGRAILKFDPVTQTYIDPAAKPAIIWGK